MQPHNSVTECNILYHDHQLNPEDFLHFVELDGFIDDWKDLGLNDEADLWALQISIMCHPKGAPVIQGTGGLRKVRFAPERWKSGKSGAVRVCYVYFPDHWTVVLVAAFGKNEKGNLTPKEKQGIKAYIQKTESWLAQRNY